MLQRDKIWHFLASIALVWIIFLILIVVNQFRRPLNTRSQNVDEEDQGSNNRDIGAKSTFCFWMDSPCGRLALSSFVALLIGTVKEIADALWNGWPWCTNGVCHADWWDFLANFIGVSVGAGILLVSLLLFPRMLRREYQQALGKT